MRDINEFSCINPECPDCGKRGDGNIKVQQTYGKNNPIRLLQCKTCGKRFSERSHTALSGSRLPLGKALSVLEHLAEGCGIRKTSRLVGVSKDTVSRLHRIAGPHAKALHDELVWDLAINEVQFDEKWSFVEKKERHLSEEEKAQGNKGDQWDHVAFAGEEKLVVSLVPGKRTEENTRELIKDFSSRANNGRPPALMTADDYGPYPKCILETYGEEVKPEPSGKPGRPRKPYKVAPPELLFASIGKKQGKNKRVKVEIRLVFGTQEALQEALKKSTVSKRVNVAFVERYNGTDRHLNARKARKTYEFSKNVDDHVHQSWLSVCYYNFCWDHRSLRIKDESGIYQHRSPAMAADITDHIWSMEELATYPVGIG